MKLAVFDCDGTLVDGQADVLWAMAHAFDKAHLPAPDPSIFAAFRRLFPVLIKQLKYEDAVIIRELPSTAQPYAKEVEKLRPHAA